MFNTDQECFSSLRTSRPFNFILSSLWWLFLENCTWLWLYQRWPWPKQSVTSFTEVQLWGTVCFRRGYWCYWSNQKPERHLVWPDTTFLNGPLPSKLPQIASFKQFRPEVVNLFDIQPNRKNICIKIIQIIELLLCPIKQPMTPQINRVTLWRGATLRP